MYSSLLFRQIFIPFLISALLPFAALWGLGGSSFLAWILVLASPWAGAFFISRKITVSRENLQRTVLGDARQNLAVVERERNENAAILANMAEGVLAVDCDERLIVINVAAAHLLGLDAVSAKGRLLVDVITEIELIQYFETVLGEKHDIACEMNLRGPPDRRLQLYGAELKGVDGKQIGAFLVLNDVTRLKRLEKVRSDFVSNVSHEIKTPLTSIKGFVETLLDESQGMSGEAQSYLEIIRKQSDRLDEIVNDLLMLSQLEKEENGNEIVFKAYSLADVIRSAVEVCQSKWQGHKQFQINVTCDPDILLPMNHRLMEQALSNLVDNAIKYGREGGMILITVAHDGHVMKVDVTDDGPGIAREYLDRLFERFYRVDAARDRDQGGSGLGLAIVKHIVQVHGGEIFVASELGHGTTFSLHLPAR